MSDSQIQLLSLLPAGLPDGGWNGECIERQILCSTGNSTKSPSVWDVENLNAWRVLLVLSTDDSCLLHCLCGCSVIKHNLKAILLIGRDRRLLLWLFWRGRFFPSADDISIPKYFHMQRVKGKISIFEDLPCDYDSDESCSWATDKLAPQQSGVCKQQQQQRECVNWAIANKVSIQPAVEAAGPVAYNCCLLCMCPYKGAFTH